MAGKTNEELNMMALMGFSGFDTTKVGLIKYMWIITIRFNSSYSCHCE